MTTFSVSEFDKASRDNPGAVVYPCATSWELMYCRLEVDNMESVDEPSESGDPNADIETSRAQCTSLRGVAAILTVNNSKPERVASNYLDHVQLRAGKYDSINC